MKQKPKKLLLIVLAAIMISALWLAGCEVDDPSSSDDADVTPPTITKTCEDSYLIGLGSKFTIPVDEIYAFDGEDPDVAPVFSVTYNGNNVELRNNAFTADQEGLYVIKITATDKSGNQATDEIKVYTTQRNELNNFNDEIRVSYAKPKGISEVSLNTNADYVKEGKCSLKLHIPTHTEESWPGVIINNLPIADISEYYSISFWVYNDSAKDVTVMLNRNEVSAKAKFTLQADSWTKIEVVARDFDDVFRYAEKTQFEPECGTCEDLKCLTFHLANPANTPAFNLYVDDVRVNDSEVFDVMDLTAKVSHPVVGVEYEMPAVTAKLGGEVVNANVSYSIKGENGEVAVANNKATFTAAGKYTLTVSAEYNGVKTKKNYMLVCASSRQNNEIEFFEEEASLNFFTSNTLKLELSSKYHIEGSTKSLKINSCESIWPTLTIGNLPHADLEGAAYMYFYAYTDYALTSTQTAYLGIKDGAQNKVLRRFILSNEWQGYLITKQDLEELGIKSLEGYQMTVELYDTENPNNGHWCPVAFDTYIDNMTIGYVEEPTQKEENVILDFANYRDLDDITSGGYTSFYCFDKKYTMNGIGSMRFAADAKWPSMTLGNKFDRYELAAIKNLLVDIFIPAEADDEQVRVGANGDLGVYTYIEASQFGKWVTVSIPVKTLKAGGQTTLKDVPINIHRRKQTESGWDWVNLRTVYIGKIAIDDGSNDPVYEMPAGKILDFETDDQAALLVHPSGNGVATTFGGKKVAKLAVNSSIWAWINLPESADKIDVSKVSYIYFDMYADMTLGESDVIRFAYKYWNAQTNAYAEKFFDGLVPAKQWFTLKVPVVSGTAKLSDLCVYIVAKVNGNWCGIGNTAGEALYINEIGYGYDDKAVTEFDFGNNSALNMFKVENPDYVTFINTDAKFINDQTKTSIGLNFTPRWPQYYFTKALTDWLTANEYETFSFDVYINSVEGARVTAIEHVGSTATLKNNEWFTVSGKVSDLVGQYIQFNKEAATNISVYISNVKFEKKQETLTGKLLDFETDDQAGLLMHPAGNGVATTFGGKKVAKLTVNASMWSFVSLPASVDGVAASNVSYIYVNLYVDTTLADGEYLRYTYKYWNGSAYAEKFFDGYIPAKQWVSIKMPVKDGTAKLSDLGMFIVKKTADDWQGVGYTDGDAIYIDEIGYGNDNATVAGFENGIEGNEMLNIFNVNNDNFCMFVNYDKAFVKEGDTSLKFTNVPRWPQYRFTAAFVNWLTANGYKSVSFDVYIDSVEGARVTQTEKIGASSSPVNNEWYTVTVDVSDLSDNYMQFNKEAAKAINIYIDNITFTK